PQWQFAGGFPNLIVALATGVGKTRLMGAIAAYLYLSGQSRNFVLLAPRAAILRKLIQETQPASPKYLFVDPGLVPEPAVWHSGNVEAFRPSDAGMHQPNIFVFSPLAFVGDDKRVTRVDEFSGVSILGHLRSLVDLVVMVDETHHLAGTAEAE